jgi:hypothetical protein
VLQGETIDSGPADRLVLELWVPVIIFLGVLAVNLKLFDFLGALAVHVHTRPL